MEIRLIRAEEWKELQDLRLQALRHDPDSFGATLDQEEADPQDEWQKWAERGAQGERHAVFVAVDGERWLGMAAGFRPNNEPESAIIFAMWVEPTGRRQGIGATLTEAVAEWAQSGGASTLGLTVTESNRPATLLYERAGFVRTGKREPLRPGSDLMKVEMARDLKR